MSFFHNFLNKVRTKINHAKFAKELTIFSDIVNKMRQSKQGYTIEIDYFKLKDSHMINDHTNFKYMLIYIGYLIKTKKLDDTNLSIVFNDKEDPIIRIQMFKQIRCEIENTSVERFNEVVSEKEIHLNLIEKMVNKKIVSKKINKSGDNIYLFSDFKKKKAG